MGEKQTVSVDEAAKCLGISRGLAYAAVNDGSIPSIRLGKRLLVPRAALQRMLDGTANARQKSEAELAATPIIGARHS